MEIRTTSLLFPETVGEGPISAETDLTFSRDVLAVTAGITGYTTQFEDGNDHHVGRMEVEVSAAIVDDDPTKVRVRGRLGLRDWSNEFDDPYSGLIDVAVLAELESVDPPDPGEARGDLVIVGAEITQVIQHFRSADHLDVLNVFPDNSVRLIAGRPTVVRLYVDHDAGSGLPPISTLSGSLTLYNPSGEVTLAPIEPITPRRDVSIDRGQRRHTLNFLLTDTQSLGELNMLAVVFDAADSTQFSAPFERTITFVQQPPLRILAVGIEYTGDDVHDDADPEDLLAPTEADFVDTLEFTDRVFPIPAVTITDYRTMEYDGPVQSDISEGCDAVGDLKDAVAEFAGDSDDLVLGLFGTGVDTGSVGGCGSSGVGVGRVFRGATIAHELGHALGRQHAPCDNVTRCATPRNTDSSYPVYSGFDSDSIGEYGFDPTTTRGTVKDPAIDHDLMGYSPNDWISPYTYKAVMSAIPGSAMSSAALRRDRAAFGPAERSEWIAVKQPKLFLRLDIHREGPVLHPSFHFDARPRITTGIETDYVLEQRDEEGRVLRSACLRAEAAGCGCGCGDDGSFPVRIRHAVSFDPRASLLVLLDCDDEFGRWEVPPPPEVRVECRPDEDDSKMMWLYWEVEGAGAAVDDGGDVWSLVQWRDRLGTWRGITPRLRDNRLRVPRRIAAMGGEVHYRVLVTTGIATGIGTCDEDCDETPPPPGDPPKVVLVGTRGGQQTQELPRVVTATTLLAGEHGGRLRWYDQRGGELSRGGRLDLNRLRRGTSVITARLDRADAPTPTGRWLVERTHDDRFVLHVGQVGEEGRHDDEPRRDHDHGGHGHHRGSGRHHHHPHTHHRDEEG
jgi:hypothetical protein